MSSVYMRKFCFICNLKTGVLLLYETHPSTEFVVQGLICMQIGITVWKRDAAPRICSLHLSCAQVINGWWCDIVMMIVVVAQWRKALSCNLIY